MDNLILQINKAKQQYTLEIYPLQSFLLGSVI